MKKSLGAVLRSALLTAGLLLMAAGPAQAIALPPVTNCGYPAAPNLLCYEPSPGVKVYVASEHDDFVSYSVNALQQLATDFGYAGLSEWSNLDPFGSGQIVKLFSFNSSTNGTFPDATGGTGDNDNASPTPDSDQTDTNDGLYMGEWPYLAEVTVADMQAFLGLDVFSPVFSFDLNNTANTALSINGQLQVRRTDGNGVTSTVATFAFDNLFNDAYDADSLVLAQDKVTVQWIDLGNPNCDPSGLCTMEVDNNVGSGKPDFFAYAPTFDLRDFEATDELYFMLRMEGLDSGGEELALTNAITPPGTNVPEPGVLALVGLGIVALGMSRRRRAAVGR